LFADIYSINVSDGRNFTEDEVKGFADTILIGSKVKDELFGDSDAVGKKIKIKDRNFRIVGVIPKMGQATFVNFDTAVVMPYTTAQQYLFGIKYFHRIVVEADKEENVPQTVDDIKRTLRENHGITDPSKDDFFIETQADAVKTVSTITNVLTLFLAAVAAISLLVGGVGIMNIMLVSVTERTREIGLRKAIGATNGDILKQFLLESVLLTTSGGITGIILGSTLSFLISVILSKVLSQSWPFVIPMSSIFLGVGVSAFIGIVFGIYPARKASLKNPIESLRYE
jgi:putative ABC transport system permease protein